MGNSTFLQRIMAKQSAKATEPCRHFLNGKCGRYKEGCFPCAYQHTEAEPGTIPCNRSVQPGHRFCDNGKKCLYRHSNQADYTTGDVVLETPAGTPAKSPKSAKAARKREGYRIPKAPKPVEAISMADMD